MSRVVASRDLRKAANFSFIEPTFHHLEQDFMFIATGSPQRVSKQEVIDHLLFVLMQIALVLSDKYFGWEVRVAGQVVPGTGTLREEARSGLIQKPLPSLPRAKAVLSRWDSVKKTVNAWKAQLTRK